MKYLLKTLTCICAMFFIGCGGLIKSEYAPINYYRLQAPTPLKSSASLPGTLLVRTFYTNAQYDSDDMFSTTGGAISNPYNYHKWVSATPELVTDFIINRLSNSQLFSRGVVASGSASAAEYILEGKVLDMLAETDERGTGVAHLQLQVSLVKTSTNMLIMQKIYDKKVARNNTSVASIAESLSAAMTQVTDEMASDLAIAVQSGGK